MDKSGVYSVALFISICCALVLMLLDRAGLAHQAHDPVVVVAVSPAFASDRTLFAATGGTTVTLAGGTARLLMKSTDGGLTWRVVPNFPNDEATGIAVSPSYAADGTVFVATSGASLRKSTDRGATWTDVGGPLGTSVAAVALSSAYGSDGTLFAAGGVGQLFTSSDGGGAWTPLAVGGSPVVTIAVSPAFGSDRTVVAGTTGQGVFRSTDGGASWSALNGGLSDLSVTALAFSPAYGTDQTIVAGTASAGVFVSQGDGTWSAMNPGLTDLAITAIALSPAYATDRTLFAATRTAGVFKSTDSGASWTKTGTVPRAPSDQTGSHYRSLAVSPVYQIDQTVFLATFEGLWRSQNSGSLWRYLELLPPSLLRSVSISPAFTTDQTMFASTYGGGMIRSADGGQSWATGNAALVNCYPDPTAVSPDFSTDRVIFAGTVWGLQKRVVADDDAWGSGAWQFLSMLGVRVFPRAVAVSPDYATDQTVFMGTDNLGTGNPPEAIYHGQPVSTDGLFMSVDGGLTWAPTGINGVPVHAVTFSPAFGADSTVFASGLDLGLMKSTDRGQTWAPVSGAPGGCCTADVVLSPSYLLDQTLYAAMPEGVAAEPGLYRSADGGASWTRIDGSAAVTILDVSISPAFASDGTVFVATLDRGLLATQNGGPLTPTGLAEPLLTALAVSQAFQTDRTILAAAYAGLFKSQDGGATWSLLPIQARFEEDRPSIARLGTWTNRPFPGASCLRVLSSATTGDALQFMFTGTRVAWIGAKGPGHGIARVLLDGVLQGNVDLYAPAAQTRQQLYLSPVLPSKGHLVTILVTGQRNPSSADATISFDAFDVWR
jgi:photosystem II stability/assembly factor-like uncharacterized protein